ncbi:MAG: hypothetical protein OEW12_10080 [Deltaproteobacteria bacterium]|nr:hypothetical protein [Deltaproteobacteria bacterium]
MTGVLSGALTFSPGLGLADSLAAREPLSIDSVVLGESKIAAGEDQLVQVEVGNPTSDPISGGLFVEIRSKGGQRIGWPQKQRVSPPPQGKSRTFFRLKTPVFDGEYTVVVELMTPNYRKKLNPYQPAIHSPFQVYGESQLIQKSAHRGLPSFLPPSGLAFEKSDLVWEHISISPPHLLMKEPAKIRAELRNLGGDVARESEIKVEYYNTRIKNQVFTLTKTAVGALAPGEKVELEFDFTFPDDTLQGEYLLRFTADPNNQVDESNKANNIFLFPDPIRLSTIRLVFPDPGYHFEETGIFLFRWETNVYDEFKVQVGTDPSFENKEDFFDIPQGEKWTAEMEITPLEGELPGMAKGLMMKNNTNTIFWRVIARSTKGVQTGQSLVQSFTIRTNLKVPSASPPSASKPTSNFSKLHSPAAPPAKPPGEENGTDEEK